MGTAIGTGQQRPPALELKRPLRARLIRISLGVLFVVGCGTVGVLLSSPPARHALFGDGKPNIAALNAKASTAVVYPNGKALVRALRQAVPAASCGPVAALTGQALRSVRTVQCTFGADTVATVDITAYVNTNRSTSLGRSAFSSYLNAYRQAKASTRPVGDHSAILLLGKNWYVNGAEKELITVQNALGGRLVNN